MTTLLRIDASGRESRSLSRGLLRRSHAAAETQAEALARRLLGEGLRSTVA